MNVIKKGEIDSSLKLVVADDTMEEEMEEVDDEDVLAIIDECFGSSHNLLQLCGGAGTYLILGPTESGKTSCIGALYKEGQMWSEEKIIKKPPIHASCFVIFSETDDLTNQLSWCKERAVKYKPTENNLKLVVEERAKEMKLGAERHNKDTKKTITPKEWAEMHPMFIIIDDYYGEIDSARHMNAMNALTTKARNYGIYQFILAQGFRQASTTIKKNARCILTFRLEADSHEEILKTRYGKQPKELVSQIVRHNQQLYKPVAYIRTWELSQKEYGNITPRPLLLPPFQPIENTTPASRIKREVAEATYFVNKDTIDSEDDSDGGRDQWFTIERKRELEEPDYPSQKKGKYI